MTSNTMHLATVFKVESDGMKIFRQISYSEISADLDIGDITVVCISQTGHTIIFGTNKGFIIVIQDYKRRHYRMRCATPIHHLLGHDIETVISASSEGVALSLTNFRDKGDFDFNDSLGASALAACWSTSIIVGGSSSGVLKVWKLDRPSVFHSISTPHSGIQALAFREDGLALASSDRLSGNVRVWCCQTWAPLLNFDVQHSASFLTFSFDGMDLVVADAGRVTLLDADIFNKEQNTEAILVDAAEPGDSEEPDNTEELVGDIKVISRSLIPKVSDDLDGINHRLAALIMELRAKVEVEEQHDIEEPDNT
ncbi:hypothetical protein ONZ45_g7179 [Pleurotus djamor]|nr:hypothetical protein ONZ45_g7179 [Pleurotus djamor]